jgi:uncharacterized protein (TIGR02466 family)
MKNQSPHEDIMKTTFWEPFSPIIMETKVPDKFVKIMNDIGDSVLSDEEKSIKWDYSHKLVGKVHKEVKIPAPKNEDKDFLFKTMKQGCVNYLNQAIKKGRAKKWAVINNHKKITPTIENMHLRDSWIVSQYAGDYNPIHHHSGDFSAVIYLKIPEGMEAEWKEDFTDHYPCNGLIEFTFAENLDMRAEAIKFKPEVGKFLVFPSYLRHFVYPFKCEGERRSMSFNTDMRIK